jgi:MOSC domain-containing protein
VNAVLSSFFGRDVTLARSAPEDFVIDAEDGTVDAPTSSETRLGATAFSRAGVPSPVPAESFMDAFPISLVTMSSLKALEALAPESRFDERRFRMNLTIDTDDSGLVENRWMGKVISIGDALRLTVMYPAPRCVMATLAQDDLKRDPHVLKTLNRHNRVPVGPLGELPCAGAYGVIQSKGAVLLGDTVALV